MLKLGVSYFGNRFLSHAKEDLRRIASCSDYVVHTLSEADLSYHKNVMHKIGHESRKLGLEVWADPWSLGGVFGGEAFSRFLMDNRDAWQVMSNGQVKPSACLNREEWMGYVKEWILTARDMGAQVMFWDEPHIAFDFESELQGVYSCFCSTCHALFKRRYGIAMPKRLNEESRQFRRDTIRTFLEEIMAFAKSKQLKNALCLYAFKGHPEYDQVWGLASQLKDLDILGCDPYWRWHRKFDPRNRVFEFARHVESHASKNGKGSQIWVQAMKLPAGKEDELQTAITAAADAKVTHIAAWSFDGGELLDPVLSERPDKVWNEVEKAFLRLRKLR